MTSVVRCAQQVTTLDCRAAKGLNEHDIDGTTVNTTTEPKLGRQGKTTRLANGVAPKGTCLVIFRPHPSARASLHTMKICVTAVVYEEHKRSNPSVTHFELL